MSQLSRYQSRLTKVKTQISVFETALETKDLGRVKSYSRGFGLNSTTYQDLDSVRKFLKELYAQEDELSDKIDQIQGTADESGVMVAAFREA